jgi:TPR repeat protein
MRRLAPWQIFLIRLVAGAAVFAVGMLFAKLFLMKPSAVTSVLNPNADTSILAGPMDERIIAAWNNQDYATALGLLRPLAESGNVRAQGLLGFAYESGLGVSRDDIEAAKWYRRGADTGDDIAQFNIGIMYRDGRGGLPRDPVRAYLWLDSAAVRGHLGAAMDRDRLAKFMNAAQIAEARELARTWKPQEP